VNVYKHMFMYFQVTIYLFSGTCNVVHLNLHYTLDIQDGGYRIVLYCITQGTAVKCFQN
jgi:hypothetical protein